MQMPDLTVYYAIHWVWHRRYYKPLMGSPVQPACIAAFLSHTKSSKHIDMKWVSKCIKIQILLSLSLYTKQISFMGKLLKQEPGLNCRIEKLSLFTLIVTEEDEGSTWWQAGSVTFSALHELWDHLLPALTAAPAWLKGTVFLTADHPWGHKLSELKNSLHQWLGGSLAFLLCAPLFALSLLLWPLPPRASQAEAGATVLSAGGIFTVSWQRR